MGAVKNNKNGEFYPAVKVIISKSCFWYRIIDASDVRRNGAKTKIIGKYKGFGWYPEGMTFNEGDTVYITEGIFKSMAFMHIGMKSISGLSAINLPIDIIKKHKGKNITWVMAQDNDNAGRKASKKFRKIIEDLGERCIISFPEIGEDWDDVYRAKRLNEKYLNDSYFRGFFYMAKSYQEKAFFAYYKYKKTHSIIDFNNSLYRYKVDQKKLADANEESCSPSYPCPEDGWLLDQDEINTLYTNFYSVAEIQKICPCRPKFLYIEKDILTKERTNTFHIEFANGTPSMLLTADGTILKSADNFSQGLLKHTGFAPFSGNNIDLSILHDRWFTKKPNFVQGVPFTGYEPQTQIYVFPNFAYHNGQHQKVNKYGFFSFGRASVKCNLKGFEFKNASEFDGSWINDLYDAFGLQGMALLAWWTGNLFAEQIRRKQDSWPFLEYTGEPGAGKSTQLRFMWRLLGVEGYEGFDPNKTTMAGRSRQMTQGSNLPIVLLEADRHEAGGRKSFSKFNWSELKNLYNGGVIRTTGIKTAGAEVQNAKFRGGIVISQNAEVDGETAILERIVHCHCTKEHFTDANTVKANRLRDLNGTDLGGFLHQVLRNERQLLHGYFRDYEKIYKKYENSMSNWRIIHNHAQITAWLYQLPLIFGNRLTAQQLQTAENYIWSRANSRLERVSGEHPLVQQFWEVYDYLNMKIINNERHYSLNHHKKSEKFIAINMPNFQQVASEARQNIASTAELLPLLKNNKTHKCIGMKPITSALENKKMKCWIFEKENSETE